MCAKGYVSKVLFMHCIPANAVTQHHFYTNNAYRAYNTCKGLLAAAVCTHC